MSGDVTRMWDEPKGMCREVDYAAEIRKRQVKSDCEHKLTSETIMCQLPAENGIRLCRATRRRVTLMLSYG